MSFTDIFKLIYELLRQVVVVLFARSRIQVGQKKARTGKITKMKIKSGKAEAEEGMCSYASVVHMPVIKF
jgi:hypothetical protein